MDVFFCGFILLCKAVHQKSNFPPKFAIANRVVYKFKHESWFQRVFLSSIHTKKWIDNFLFEKKKCSKRRLFSWFNLKKFSRIDFSFNITFVSTFVIIYYNRNSRVESLFLKVKKKYVTQRWYISSSNNK